MTCTWTADFTGIQDKWDAITDDAVKERALLLATSSLLVLTNNRIGTCPVTIRPCPQPLPCGQNWEPYRYQVLADYLHGGDWLNACGCKTAHWCAPLSEVDLPGPVGYISSIKVDGAELALDTGDWRLDNGHLLVWQGAGPSPIPVTQDLNKPDTQVGTWSITYSRSAPVTRDGQIAVAWLALEFVKAFEPKGKCALPRAVRSVTRSGVSFTIEASLFPGGLTGIDVVDQFILKWNPPGSPTRSAQVFSPRDVGRKPRQTGLLLTAPPVAPAVDPTP